MSDMTQQTPAFVAQEVEARKKAQVVEVLRLTETYLDQCREFARYLLALRKYHRRLTELPQDALAEPLRGSTFYLLWRNSTGSLASSLVPRYEEHYDFVGEPGTEERQKVTHGWTYTALTEAGDMVGLFSPQERNPYRYAASGRYEHTPAAFTEVRPWAPDTRDFGLGRVSSEITNLHRELTSTFESVIEQVERDQEKIRKEQATLDQGVALLERLRALTL